MEIRMGALRVIVGNDCAFGGFLNNQVHVVPPGGRTILTPGALVGITRAANHFTVGEPSPWTGKDGLGNEAVRKSP